MVKISSKVLATTAAAATTSSPSPVTISGKTAVKTSNGQIIYIQKAAGGGQRLSATAAAATTSGLTATASGALTTTSIGNKTVAIQVIRAADGSIVPVKTTAAAASSASTNVVTTQLSGKQIIIKAPLKTSATTSVSAVETSSSASTAGATATTTTTFAKDALKMGMQFQKLSGVATVAAGTPTITTGGKIVVQSANGKQIVVSNQNLIKLSPKPPPTTAAAAAGQLQAIQIPGKGLQYVRVVPNSKITVSTAGTATIQTTSIANVASGISATTPPTTSTSTLKILNAMPQKFTVVRPNAVTKFMLTQSPKKEGSTATSISGGSVPVTFSPVTSKVQKTIVTVPTLRAIGDGNPTIAPSGSSGHTPSAQATLVKNFLSGTTPTNSGGFSLVRKHKISEINSEIQRITTMPTSGSETSVSGGGGGGQQTETKKTAGGQRIVVMSRSMLQPRQGTLQRVMAPGSAGSTNLNAVSSASTSAVPTNAMAPRKQFSVLKKPVENPYNNPAQAEMKSLIICGQAKALMAQQQQQHKTFMLKRQFNKVLTSTVAPASSFVAIQKPVAAAAAVAAAAIAPQPKPSFIKIERKPTVDDEYLDDEAFLRDIKPSLESLAEEAGATGAPRRKHCNCSKSQCLKLYCDCFANGEFCQDCTCKDCFNNLQYEDERQRAIKVCLERNPSAFKPKITTARDQGDMRLHNKGCNCKRSGCLKNYCECYEAKIPCSSNCKCVGCRNIEDRVDLDMDPIDPKIMATIANATAAYGSCGAQKRNYDRANSSGQNRSGSGASNSHNEKMLKEAAKSMAMHSNNNDLISAGGSSSTSSSVIGGGGINLGGSPPEKQQQCNFITQEVIDATIQCMISQADECEKNGLPAYQTEKMIMEELGRCLVEIIDFSIRNTDTSYTQE